MFLGSIICMPDPEAAAKRDAMFLGGDAPETGTVPDFDRWVATARGGGGGSGTCKG